MKVPRLFVDGHVHIYSAEQATEALDAASGNFYAAAQLADTVAGYGLLLLADPKNAPAFDWLCGLPAALAGQVPEAWSIVSRPDEHTIHLTKAGMLPLAILAGRQVISAENLEVLVFPRTVAGRDGGTLQSLVTSAISANGLAILPWGVGKWLGARGRLVRNILATITDDRLTVGDNGGRPSFWHKAAILQEANEKGITNIPGSDPLPVVGEIGRIGSFGGGLAVAVDALWSSVQFIDLLSGADLTPYGNPIGFTDFVAKQAALRRRKHI